MNVSFRRSVVLAVAVLGAAPMAAAEVYFVSGANLPGTDFTNLQVAIDAAADGDVLLVANSGVIPEAVIGNKSLVIAGVESEGTGLRPLVTRLAVVGLEAGKSIVVRDFQVFFSSNEQNYFDVTDCAGAVLFENCRLHAGVNQQNKPISVANVKNSAHVLFTRCDFEGSDGLGTPGFGGTSTATIGGPGLVVEASSVTLYECHVTGGKGSVAFFYADSPILPVPSSGGGQGIQVWSGMLNLVGTTVQAGAGGAGSDPATGGVQCLAPSPGGAGVRSFGTVRRLDSQLTGGAGGAGVSCFPAAASGQEIVLLPGGSVMSVPEAARSLEISSALENGGTCSVALHGAPGELLTLLLSFTPSASWHVGLKGTLAGQPPYVTALLGPLDGNGALAFDVPLAGNLLPAAVDSLSFTAQAIAAASSGGGLLSSPTAVLLVHDVPHVP